jgi:hypothetical protein
MNFGKEEKQKDQNPKAARPKKPANKLCIIYS